jgi:hypothetical protein
MKQRKRKMMKSLILALAVAAIIPPVAQARIDSERSQIVRPASNYYSSQAYRALMVRSEAMNVWYRDHNSTVARPDDRAGVRGPGISNVPQLVSSSGNGFDWGDASLGAGSALVAAIILSSGIAVSRRSRAGTLPV